jgi:anti-sigma factor RsiW
MRRLLAMLMPPDPERCAAVRELLSEHMAGELSAPEHRRVRRHLRLCSRCHRVFANLRATVRALSALGDEADGDAAGRDAVERLAISATADG